MPVPSPAPDAAHTVRFGVATAALEVEGSLNGPGEPRNSWWSWERDGRVDPSGLAVDLWTRYEEALDHAVALGCDGFRLSLEWARCAPADGEADDEAWQRYRQVLLGCRERGLAPLVTLHHLAHPWWLGPRFWLEADSPLRFEAWCAEASERVGDLVEEWVTIHEPTTVALGGWLTAELPPGHRLDPWSVRRALDHLLTAHILGYEALKARRPDSTVSLGLAGATTYELDRMLSDALSARLHGISRAEVDEWLATRRDEHLAALTPLVGREQPWRSWARRAFAPERAIPRALDAAHVSPHPCTLDALQLDAHQPTLGEHLGAPGRHVGGGRARHVRTLPWEEPATTGRLEVTAGARTLPGRDAWLLGHGLATRVHHGRPRPRLDGRTRVRHLRDQLRTLVALLDAGVPVRRFDQRWLVDGWEGGSFEARRGIHGIDRARGLRWMDTDASGRDAAGAYRRMIEGLRAGDRSVVGL